MLSSPWYESHTGWFLTVDPEGYSIATPRNNRGRFLIELEAHKILHYTHVVQLEENCEKFRSSIIYVADL